MTERADEGLGLGRDVDELAVARTVFDLARSAIFMKDLDACFIWANRGMLERFGFETVDEIRGRDDFDIHPHDRATTYYETDRLVLDTGVTIDEQDDWQTGSSGERILVRTTKQPVRDRHGEIVGLLGISADVTEPARVSAALADSEERYALAARATRDGIWDYDVETDSVTMSPRCAEILDVPLGPAEIQREIVEQRIGRHQIDAISKAVTDGSLDLDEPWSFDLDVTLDDGSIRCVNIVGTIVFRDGVPLRVVGSAADATAERRRQAELRFQALHDDLTGLRNRRSLLDALAGPWGSLLYLDLDAFKVVNDSLGHQAGDEMLIAVSERLLDVVGEENYLFRLGGDEFAVLLPPGSEPDPRQVARKIGDALRTPFTIDELEIYSTASIGVVIDLDEGRDPTETLRDADTALYEAKAAGKARATVFEPAMRSRAEAALELQMRIRRAVEQSEFELHYQPIVDPLTGAMAGVEALLRWRREPDRLESPAIFLSHLEESKLIVPVGRWVIETACDQLSRWRREHPAMSDLRLSLNVSRVQFDSPDLVGTLAVAVDRHDLGPDQLVVEITETAVTERTAELRARVESLRELGVRVAIDDFGVGQSSLSALHDIPADILKIDRSFVERVDGETEEPIMRAVITLARSLGMTTVAEGVETESQRRWLVGTECDLVQGYLISPPVPAADIPAMFASALAPLN